MAATKILVVVMGLLLAGVVGANERRLSVPLLDTKPYGWVDAVDSGVRMLLAHRVDGFCSVQESLTDAINGVGSQVVFQGAQRLVLASKPVFLMVSRSLPAATVAQLTKGLESLHTSGELSRIFKRRLGEGYALRLTQ